MGTPAFACPALEHLHSSRHEIIAVVTGTDKPVGRGKKLQPTEVARKASELGYPVIKPASLKDDDLYEKLKSLSPDLMVVVAFRILPRRLFALPRLGAINIHASLLPRYRGAAPINWALINGETETGLTSFLLNKSVDTGDILLQQKVAIEEADNYDSLYQRLAQMAGPFAVRTVDLLEQGEIAPVPQNSEMATAAPKIGPFDALIDFGFPADKVCNFVRGLSSRPGAYTFFRGRKLKILDCRVAEAGGEPKTRPGTIVNNRKILLVQCAASAIALTSVIPEGKKQMDGASFINGFRPEVGEVLGDMSTGGK